MKLTEEELEQAKREAARYLSGMARSGKAADCPRCNGSGSVRVGLGRRTQDFKRCPECVGAGKVTLTQEDVDIMKKYPRHTLAQAREIDGPRLPYTGNGIVSGFEKLIAQERGDFHLGGEHT
jgi:hypothetical protein